MSELRHGKGGYGGILSLNSENRVSAYLPHTVMTKENYQTGKTECKCLKCEKTWQHPRGSKFSPKGCKINA